MALPKIVVTKKAQSALEFLTTYGWAFLVILIMIGALSYFGVLDPSRFLPEKCVFGVGIGGCLDQGILGNNLQFLLVNNFGKDVYLQGANITVTGTSTTCAPAANAIALTVNNGSATAYTTPTVTQNTLWPSNAQMNLTVYSCTIASGERPLARITFQITPVGSTYPKLITGEVSVRKP